MSHSFPPARLTWILTLIVIPQPGRLLDGHLPSRTARLLAPGAVVHGLGVHRSLPPTPRLLCALPPGRNAITAHRVQALPASPAPGSNPLRPPPTCVLQVGMGQCAIPHGKLGGLRQVHDEPHFISPLVAAIVYTLSARRSVLAGGVTNAQLLPLLLLADRLSLGRGRPSARRSDIAPLIARLGLHAQRMCCTRCPPAPTNLAAAQADLSGIHPPQILKSLPAGLRIRGVASAPPAHRAWGASPGLGAH
ncbi:hypothetical protein C8R44DRAFT_988538 [Mycena epipterygia]|nr:hypothetical protein C8R44DRAFT_988538 [Mycena epipterygia]